jgi:hypothetical protein
MSQEQSLDDLLVVVPGITGSVLANGGGEVWALSGRAIMRGVLTLGRSVDRLTLPEGFGATLPENEGEGVPNDGVEATRLMPDLHVLPGMWSPIKGYSGLIDEFRRQFSVTEDFADRPGNLIGFPYDWRLSNAVSGRRLAARVVPALERWRTQSGNPEAKLVLVCHSMGGLVARWFLEVLGGWELTRWLVTVGTPYQGAVNALETLANGVSKGLGPFKKDLSGLVRSFPSVYELLPTYPCLDPGVGELRLLTESSAGLDTGMIASASLFHRRIAEKLAQRDPAAYGIVAIKGIHQPTSQSALLTDDGIQALRIYGGIDRGGDGTVPRPSAHPPEWPTEGGHTVWAAQRHSTLQETEAVYSQLFGLLTGRLGTWMGGEQIGLEVPELLPVGEDVEVEVSADDHSLALIVALTNHDDPKPVAAPELMTNLGEGRYTAKFSGLSPGTYQVTVTSAVATRPVDPVADVAIVWDPADAT